MKTESKINLKYVLKSYGFALLSGLLLIVCFPPVDLFYVAWIALVPFFLSLYEKSTKQAFRAGILFGIPYFFGTLYWIYHSINHYGNLPFVASISIVILLCCFLSLYSGIFAVLFITTLRKTKLPALLIAPVFWVVLEFVRSYFLTGFPWSSIGYSQAKFLTMIQIADITGIYGVSFLVVAINGALADIFLLKKRIEDMPLFPLSYTIIGAGVLCLVILSTVIYGQVRLNQERPGKDMTVSIAQGNIEQDMKWDPQYQNAVMDVYKDLSLKAKSFNPAVIVWPETALPFHFGTDDVYTQELIDFQKQLNTYLLFGSVLVKEQSDERYHMSNSAVLLDTDGNTVYTYDKIHLVPFGEYVPLRNILFFIDKMVVGIGDYIPGETHVLAPLPLGSFAPLICYEIIFPGLVRKFFAHDGDLIVNMTNDAWFGRTSGPYQHFSMAVFRAIENRKPVIRAANTGISGFIDSNGRVLSRSDLFQRELLVMKIRTDSTRSFYSKYGDLFSYIWIVFSIILITNMFGKSKYI